MEDMMEKMSEPSLKCSGFIITELSLCLYLSADDGNKSEQVLLNSREKQTKVKLQMVQDALVLHSASDYSYVWFW